MLSSKNERKIKELKEGRGIESIRKKKAQNERVDESEDRIGRMAVDEILKDTKISKIRAESSGSWHCDLRKTNKRFLKSAIVATLSHNERESRKHRERSEKKLARLDRRMKEGNGVRLPRDLHRDRRCYFRNPFAEEYRRHRNRDYSEDRALNYRKKQEQMPRRSPKKIHFVKPRDLDDRVLIPGQPKKAQVKEINFVAAHSKTEQFLSHDGIINLQMARIRKQLREKIPKQMFVPPFLEKERFFHLAGDQVGGLIRQAPESMEEPVKLIVPILLPSSFLNFNNCDNRELNFFDTQWGEIPSEEFD